MKILAKQLEEKKNKATEMIGKKLEVQVSRKAISIDSEKKTAIFVMSTCNIDRHGEVIDQDSWKLDNFLKSPMFFLNHNSDQFPIGKWLRVWFEEDVENPGKKMLLGEAEFRTEFEDASRAFVHIEKGDMSAVSVGFIPHRVEYDEATDCFVLYDNELLECSLVGVGSNRQALVRATDEEMREQVIEAKKVLDAKIKKVNDNNLIIAHLKARENLNKAIRRMKI